MDINYEILQYFAYKKVIKRKDITSIKAECDRLAVPPETYMQAKEICNEIDTLSPLGEFYTMPYTEVDMLEYDRDLVAHFEYAILKKHKFLPVTLTDDGVLIVALGKPLDMYARSVIATEFTCKTEYIFVPPKQIDNYIDSITAEISTKKALSDLNINDDVKVDDALTTLGENAVASVEDVINNPAVRLADSIIKEAIPMRASDIHIEPFEKVVKVRYRIDGELQQRIEFPIENYSAICARFKIMSGINIAERRIPQDGRISMLVSGVEYDFRVSTLPTVYGEKIVIRILSKTSFNFTRAELGFTEGENVVVDKMLAHSHGIILLTGPTGCGKTTTLYSFIKELNKPNLNIVTIEDPVEYTLHGVNQVQVNNKANLTFASALRSILRQDPDVIMVGEMRDEETAEIGVRAAITGHLVFSTLHTNDALGAITRLEDMKVSDYLVSDALVGVIAQRLVRKLCPMCKRRSKTTQNEMQLLGLTESATLFRPQGCQFCNNTGYKGRTSVHEILYMTERLRQGVTQGESIDSLREIAQSDGMSTLWQNGVKMVLRGITDIGELMSLFDG